MVGSQLKKIRTLHADSQNYNQNQYLIDRSRA